MYLIDERKKCSPRTNGDFQKPDIIWSLITKCNRPYDIVGEKTMERTETNCPWVRAHSRWINTPTLTLFWLFQWFFYFQLLVSIEDLLLVACLFVASFCPHFFWFCACIFWLQLHNFILSPDIHTSNGNFFRNWNLYNFYSFSFNATCKYIDNPAPRHRVNVFLLLSFILVLKNADCSN